MQGLHRYPSSLHAVPLHRLCLHCSAERKDGFAIHIYTASTGMQDSCLANADGDMLIVPQQGRLVLLYVRKGGQRKNAGEGKNNWKRNQAAEPGQPVHVCLMCSGRLLVATEFEHLCVGWLLKGCSVLCAPDHCRPAAGDHRVWADGGGAGGDLRGAGGRHAVRAVHAALLRMSCTVAWRVGSLPCCSSVLLD